MSIHRAATTAAMILAATIFLHGPSWADDAAPPPSAASNAPAANSATQQETPPPATVPVPPTATPAPAEASPPPSVTVIDAVDAHGILGPEKRAAFVERLKAGPS